MGWWGGGRGTRAQRGLYLGYISATSRRHLGDISAVSRRHLAAADPKSERDVLVLAPHPRTLRLPRCSRDMAEIYPRSGRDLAEIWPRSGARLAPHAPPPRLAFRNDADPAHLSPVLECLLTANLVVSKLPRSMWLTLVLPAAAHRTLVRAGPPSARQSRAPHPQSRGSGGLDPARAPGCISSREARLSPPRVVHRPASSEPRVDGLRRATTEA